MIARAILAVPAEVRGAGFHISGKSARQQAIGIANGTHERRILIICDAGSRDLWREAVTAESYLPWVKCYVVKSAKFGIHPDVHFTIISHELMRDKYLAGLLHRMTPALTITDRKGHVIVKEGWPGPRGWCSHHNPMEGMSDNDAADLAEILS